MEKKSTFIYINIYTSYGPLWCYGYATSLGVIELLVKRRKKMTNMTRKYFG